MSKMTDDTLAWLKGFSSSNQWIKGIRSQETLDNYTKYLHQYCQAVQKNPDELIALKVEGLRNIATEKEFQAEQLLNNYLYDNTDLTINIKLSVWNAVKSFYKANWRELNKNVGKELTKPEPDPRTPKMKDIIEMEEAMTYHRDKAILWFVESASCRQGTTIKLNWKDLKPTSELLKHTRDEGQSTRSLQEDSQIAKEVPFYLEIESERLKGAGKGKYKGVKQISFLHHFAVKKLEAYKEELKKRNITITPDAPIFVALESNQHNRKGDRLTQLQSIFWNASVMAWQEGEKMFSAQDFRDVLQSALENANVHPNIASPMLAHKVKGVDKHYSNHDIVEFLFAFRSALPWLLPQTVEKVTAKLDEEQRRLSIVENRNTTLEKKVDDMSQLIGMADLINSKQDWDEVQNFFKELRWKKELKERAEANQWEEKSKEAFLREQKGET